MSGRQPLLLAEELAFVAIRPRTGRPPIGVRYALNACLAGLLMAELELADCPPDSATLAAAARVVAEKGPKLTAILSHMDRGLSRDTGRGTWDLVTSGLHDLDASRRDQIQDRLRTVAADDSVLDPRTALLLAFIGPARQLEVVAPGRRGRRHARQRIDGALAGSPFEPLRVAVRRVIAEQESVTVVSGSGGSC